MSGTRPWFKPKYVGYGATPITWEGWALVAAFALANAAAAWFLLVRGAAAGEGPSIGRIVAFVAVDLVLVAGLVIVSKAKTAGEWRWRRGDRDAG